MNLWVLLLILAPVAIVAFLAWSLGSIDHQGH